MMTVAITWVFSMSLCFGCMQKQQPKTELGIHTTTNPRHEGSFIITFVIQIDSAGHARRPVLNRYVPPLHSASTFFVGNPGQCFPTRISTLSKPCADMLVNVLPIRNSSDEGLLPWRKWDVTTICKARQVVSPNILATQNIH